MVHPTRRFAAILAGGAALFLAAPESGLAQSPCGDFVAVERGDTLRSIAQSCGTSVAALARVNDLQNPNIIHVGQRLTIPGARSGGGGSEQGSADSGRHQVQSGETLYSIAQAYRIGMAALLQANPGIDPDDLPIGSIIDLPGEVPGPGTPDWGQPPGDAQISVSADAAAPGEPVSIRASGFPADSPVLIGGGPPESEYEVLARTRTDAGGEVSQSVEIPQWASDNRALVFVVETADRRVQATSDPVRIAESGNGGGDGEAITVTGRLTQGTECPALQGDDGRFYTLAVQDLGRFEEGDRVQVRGAEAQASICMQGTTIDVEEMRAVG